MVEVAVGGRSSEPFMEEQNWQGEPGRRRPATPPHCGRPAWHCRFGGLSYSARSPRRLVARCSPRGFPDGDPEQICSEETEPLSRSAEGHYRIEGHAFIYSQHDTGRVTTILTYPTRKPLRYLIEISNLLGSIAGDYIGQSMKPTSSLLPFLPVGGTGKPIASLC